MVYVAEFFWVHGASQPRRNRIMAVTTVLLAVCGALMWPAIGAGVIGLLPYFGAALLFPSPIRRAPLIVMTLLAAAVLLSVLDSRVWSGGGYLWSLLGPVIGLFCVLMGRYADHHSSEKEKALRSAALTEERSRIGRDVHDLLGHSLTVISVKAELAARLVGSDPAAARAELVDIQQLSREGLARVRSTVTELNGAATSQGASADHGSKDGGDLARALADAGAALRSAGVVLKAGPMTPHTYSLTVTSLPREGKTA